ncbi:MAG: hypothetical protein Q7R22_006665 [Verrucomicrobiota bacterium JB025]|nr:hypothetical protein [Verrucomicrobiota bacterium JB025]
MVKLMGESANNQPITLPAAAHPLFAIWQIEQPSNPATRQPGNSATLQLSK